MQFRCDVCRKSFKTEQAFQQHNQSKHSGNQMEARKHKTKKSRGGRDLKFPAAIFIIIVLGVSYFMVFSGSAYTPKLPDTNHVKGTGNIEIIEFSDFECPACGSAFGPAKDLVKQYSDKVKLTYKHFPLSQIHPYAQKAAEASECAADQGKFWEMHDKLFQNQKVLDVNSLKKYASELDLNTEDFNACLDSGVMANRVIADYNEGAGLGIGSTPTFFVNNKSEPGAKSLEDWKQLLSL